MNVWFSHNGERLGTYSGHNGTVWTCDVDSTSTLLITGSADNSLRLWRVADGTCLKVWDFPTAVKRVAWSEDDKKILAITEQRMGHAGTIRIFEINRDDLKDQPDTPEIIITPTGSKATVAAWTYLDKYIVTGHESGKVALFDPKTGDEVVSNDKVHEEVITDLQLSYDSTYILTSSKDKTAKLLNLKELSSQNLAPLSIIKDYRTETPLNSAALVPGKPYVILGGGQEAMAVTTTSSRQGHFEIRFWHRIFEEEVSRAKGGFGPCNTIAVHPLCQGYAIGGEDGYVRVHHFDDEFLRSRPYGAEMEPTED